MAALPDVNVLLALVDSDHLSHESARAWFQNRHQNGWATCPITENGMIRVLSQPSYPSGQRTPAEAIEILTDLKTAFADTHEFWPDCPTMTDGAIFNVPIIAGTRQVTDVYLLGLAARHKGKLASFDRSLAWQAVKGATASLIEAPGKMPPHS